jgi:hypothetical protein
MRKIVISALIAGAAVVATPASAQSWFNQRPNVAHSQIRGEINQLTLQISRAEQRRAISPREAQGLRRQMIQVQRNFANYSRNGLNRRETATLNNQLAQVRRGLRTERRDYDRRRG